MGEREIRVGGDARPSSLTIRPSRLPLCDVSELCVDFPGRRVQLLRRSPRTAFE